MKKKLSAILIILSIAGFLAAKDKKDVTIGLVADYTDETLIQYTTGVVKSEIQKTLGSSYNVILNKEDILLSLTTEEVINNYKKLTENCDVIFLYGPVAVKKALTAFRKFPKPTLGIGVFDTDLQEIPYTSKGTSGVSNFSYVLTKNSIDVDFEKFKEMHDFKRVTVVYEKSMGDVIGKDRAKKRFNKLGKQYKAVFDFAEMDSDPEALRKQIRDNKADSVYFIVPIVHNPELIKKMISVFTEEKLPSFAFNNDTVALGILGSYGSRKDYRITVVRKLAIMIDESLNGVDPSGMQVDIHDQEELYLNMNVADAIDYSPPFNLLFSAELIGEVGLGKKAYTVEEVIAKALEKNLNIKISEKDVEIADQDLKEAGSRFLPDISSTMTATFLDKDLTSDMTGRAQRSLSSTLKLQQMVFSDQVIAGRKIQKYIKAGKEFTRMSEVNDVVLNSLQAYLNVLKAKTGVIIQDENYRSSKKNLDFAELRVRLGSSDKSEVYRWRSEVATARQSLIEAHIAEELARVQLNNLLDNCLGDTDDFDIKDIALYGEFFEKTSGIFGMEVIRTPKDLELLTKFLTQKASKIHPSELALRANRLAVEKQIKMNKRRYWLPDIYLGAQLDNTHSRGGAGSNAPAGINIPDTTWSVGLTVSTPVFEGGRRKIELSRNILKKKQLDLNEKYLLNNIALNIRANVMNLAGASTNIVFSEKSSRNAEKNYKLVQENYKQGTVSIVQLIDAQKASLNAKQAYAVSLYNFMDTLFKLEHGIGHFYLYDDSKKGKEVFEEEFRNYKKYAGRR